MLAPADPARTPAVRRRTHAEQLERAAAVAATTLRRRGFAAAENPPTQFLAHWDPALGATRRADDEAAQGPERCVAVVVGVAPRPTELAAAFEEAVATYGTRHVLVVLDCDAPAPPAWAAQWRPAAAGRAEVFTRAEMQFDALQSELVPRYVVVHEAAAKRALDDGAGFPERCADDPAVRRLGARSGDLLLASARRTATGPLEVTPGRVVARRVDKRVERPGAAAPLP